MNVERGDVVLLDYPYSSGGGAKVRPVLVVQNDRDNRRLTNTIVVQITSVTHRALQPTQALVGHAQEQSSLLNHRILPRKPVGDRRAGEA